MKIMIKTIDSYFFHSFSQKIQKPFSFQEKLHADYGWCSLTHFAKRVDESHNLALKILANFADAILGFGIIASAVYNPGAYLYNSTLAKSKNQTIDSWNQKVTLRREIVQELLLALGAAIPSAILQKFCSDSPSYWRRSFLIWTLPLLFNNLLRVIQPNDTGKIRNLIEVMKKVSLVAVAEMTIHAWIHEFGHFLCSKLLFQCPLPLSTDSWRKRLLKYLENPFLSCKLWPNYPSLMGSSSIILTDFHLTPCAVLPPDPSELRFLGQLFGEKADMLFFAAGPLFSLAFSISQMIVAHSLEKGFVKSILSANANFGAATVLGLYSFLTLMLQEKRYAFGDYGTLWRKGNIHPLTSFFVAYVLPMSFQFYLWHREKKRNLPDKTLFARATIGSF
jgi:hypothetical protein